MNAALLLPSVLNGLSYGLLLFMLSAGLTLIFGMMRMLNMAHGSFYMLGAYLGYSLTCIVGVNFWLALLFVPCLVGALGYVLERGLISKIRNSGRGHLAELLLTYGLALVIFSFVELLWGKGPVDYVMPSVLQGSLFKVGGMGFPRYRAMLMFIALVVLILFVVLWRYTRMGVILSAASQNARMLEMLGYNVNHLWACVFGMGCALAGLAGVIGGLAYVTEPAMAQSMGMLLFVVIIMGGLGSVAGAFCASILIGLLQTFAVGLDMSLAQLLGTHTIESPLLNQPLSQWAPLLPFILLLIVLVLRPQGLLGEKADARS